MPKAAVAGLLAALAATAQVRSEQRWASPFSLSLSLSLSLDSVSLARSAVVPLSYRCGRRGR
jgi:hypothetical protein|eukprot:COSAG06_NODE_38099_length_427_cov_1.064024_1_plen_62_part_00